MLLLATMTGLRHKQLPYMTTVAVGFEERQVIDLAGWTKLPRECEAQQFKVKGIGNQLPFTHNMNLSYLPLTAANICSLRRTYCKDMPWPMDPSILLHTAARPANSNKQLPSAAVSRSA